MFDHLLAGVLVPLDQEAQGFDPPPGAKIHDDPEPVLCECLGRRKFIVFQGHTLGVSEYIYIYTYKYTELRLIQNSVFRQVRARRRGEARRF